MRENKDTDQKTTNKEANEGRREALKKLGKYAYTAPVVLSLLSPKKSDAAFPPLPSPPNP